MDLVGTVTPVTLPRVTDLTTLARFKERSGITDARDDAAYKQIITAASAAVANRLGWEPARAQETYTFRGEGQKYLRLPRRPFVELVDATLDGTSVDQTSTDIWVDQAAASILTRALGWTAGSTPTWAVTYWAGFLLPGDDVLETTVATFAASGQTITLSSGTWPLLRAGDVFQVVNSTSALNDGRFVVASRTSTVLTAAAGSGLVDEAAGASVSVLVSNLPGEIEEATMGIVREAFRSRKSGGEVTSSQLGPLKLTYGDVSNVATRESEALLRRYALVL